MRVKLGLAIILSLVLIGLASWSRFFDRLDDSNKLALESTPGQNNFGDLLESYLEKNSAATSTSSSTPTTKTVELGRSLIVDYVNLATNGQATQENLDALAQKYVEIIPNLESSATITANDLKIVSSTKVNLGNYSDNLVNIENDYRRQVTTTYSTSPSAVTLGTNLYTVMGKVANIYEQTAEELQNMQVPSQVAEQHTRLVNYYLSTALSMRSISQGEADPAIGFAGLLKLQSTVDDEDAILNSIGAILEANGI